MSSHFVWEGHAAKRLAILKEPPKDMQIRIEFKPFGCAYRRWYCWHLDCWLEHVGQRVDRFEELPASELRSLGVFSLLREGTVARPGSSAMIRNSRTSDSVSDRISERLVDLDGSVPGDPVEELRFALVVGASCPGEGGPDSLVLRVGLE